LFGDRQCIIDLDAEVADSALQLGVAEATYHFHLRASAWVLAYLAADG
jgi:hypothetical protein